MKTSIFYLLFISGLFLNASIAQTIADKQLTTKFDQLLSDKFKSNETGGTALVARKGQIIYKKAFGMANLELNIPMQTENVFRIGSITKQFTAIAILQLMEQGKLDLQDDITKFIPDYPTHGHKITIEHLLTHTSGIQSYTGMKDFDAISRLDKKPEELIAYFKNQPMEFAPGTKWNYNNSGFFLLGYIIEKVTGKTYPEYVEEKIFKTLGMTQSYYGSDSKIIKNRASAYSKVESGFVNAEPLSMTLPYSAGSLQSTVEDLFKWNQAVHSYKLVNKENLDKAFTSYILADGKKTNYGYGWSLGNIQGSPTIEHGGGIPGFLTMGIYLPVEDVFVAVFSNCDCNGPDDVTAKLAALTIGKPYEYREFKVDSSVQQKLTGVYEKEGSDEQRFISFKDNQLSSQRNRGEKYKLKPYAKDKYFFESNMTTIEFVKNQSGDVEKLIVKGRQPDEFWIKSNKPIPLIMEIDVDETILDTYVGDYELEPNFILTVTKEKNRLMTQATGQGKIEIFAETETKFFVKVMDAQLEFIKGVSGKVEKLILTQGGRKMDAKKIK
ncbi:MAG: serine hydrolase [Saprospiraceae bacterium]|jgi:CubicO group peptidase (beta-lactamase class C family)|nr:serine hydrolase [Saprospiraceae bacterium]